MPTKKKPAAKADEPMAIAANPDRPQDPNPDDMQAPKNFTPRGDAEPMPASAPDEPAPEPAAAPAAPAPAPAPAVDPMLRAPAPPAATPTVDADGMTDAEIEAKLRDPRFDPTGVERTRLAQMLRRRGEDRRAAERRA